jgi:hypothetical protein
MLLVAMSSPGRSVSSVSKIGSLTCTVQPTAVLNRAAAKRFRMKHADLPTAILASLISSLLNADEGLQAKGFPNRQGKFYPP